MGDQIISKPVKVKICGITTPDQAEIALDAGADALGVVLYKASPRNVCIEKAQLIRSVVSSNSLYIALMVNATESIVRSAIEKLKPDLLQFHGDESPCFCHQFNYPFIRAVRMRDGLHIPSVVKQYRAEGGFLFDSWNPSTYGGTGVSFDWSQLPVERSFPLILAGGLTTENVVRAVDTVSPDMVDVSGGVETSPGIKDPVLVKKFITAVKSAK